MARMEKSVVLSKCGRYLVLEATLDSARWQKIISIPGSCSPVYKAKTPTPILPPPPSNPRVIGSEPTYWYQHRYKVSISRQRVLLTRTARSKIDINRFSQFGCHVELAVIPAYLAGAGVSLVIPGDDKEGLKIVLVTNVCPVEVITISMSWNEAMRELEGIMVRHPELEKFS